MAKVNLDLASKLGFLSIGCSCSDGFKKGHIKESIYMDSLALNILPLILP